MPTRTLSIVLVSSAALSTAAPVPNVGRSLKSDVTCEQQEPAIESLFECNPFGQQCGSVYMPPQQPEIETPFYTAKNLYTFGMACNSAAEGDPLPLMTLPFKLFGSDETDTYDVNDQFIEDMARNVQNYVVQEIAASDLRELYAGIVGTHDMFKNNLRYYHAWTTSNGEGKDNVISQIISTNNNLIDRYPLYESASPWMNPMVNSEGQAMSGPNGYGIYYSAYVTLMLTGFQQAVAVIGFNNSDSAPALGSLVEYAWKGVIHSRDLVNEYVKQRESNVQGPRCFDLDDEPGPCPGEGATGDGIPYITIDDRYAFYETASATATETCTWHQLNMMPFITPQKAKRYQVCNPDWINTASKNCMEGRKQFVTGPVVNNWNAWLIEPAKQWAALADEICDQTEFSAVKFTCNKYSEKYGMKASDYIIALEAKPEILRYKVQQTCQQNYPGADVVAVNIPATVGGCNDHFKSVQPNAEIKTPFWDMGNAGESGWTCCLATDPTTITYPPPPSPSPPPPPLPSSPPPPPSPFSPPSPPLLPHGCTAHQTSTYPCGSPPNGVKCCQEVQAGRGMCACQQI